MSLDPLNRKLSLLGSLFAFVGVILGAIALGTDYWTSSNYETPNRALEMVNGTILISGQTNRTWNGLFYSCSNQNSTCQFNFVSATFILCLLGLILLLMSGIFLCWDIIKISDRRFLIPLLVFFSCVFLTAGLVDYGSFNILNSHSSRLMISSLVFAYSVLPIASFVAGRHSTLNQFMNNDKTNSGQKFLSTTNGN